MKSSKIIGYILITVSLVVIIGSLIGAYRSELFGENEVVENNFIYKLETDENLDVRIVKLYDNGEKEDVAGDLVEKAGLDASKIVFIEFAIPENSNRIYLKEYLNDTDYMGGDIWAFDVETKRIERLDVISDTLTAFGAIEVSPDKKSFVHIPDLNDDGDVKIIQHMDLEKDEVNTIVTLEGNETFNAGYGALSNHFEIKWIDGNSIEYAVYDQAGGLDDKNYYKGVESYKPLIERRAIDL